MSKSTIPEQMALPDGTVFPLVYSPPAGSHLQWAKDNRLDLAQELKQHGAILFRGFEIHSAEDFQHFVEALGIKPLPYVGGAAVRHTVYKDVHTTNESPPDQPIPFHHEMAQVPKYPECLFFYCFVAPTSGVFI
jgi:alpha-ketoglutarate-dependent taurine dioxygenase